MANERPKTWTFPPKLFFVKCSQIDAAVFFHNWRHKFWFWWWLLGTTGKKNLAITSVIVFCILTASQVISGACGQMSPKFQARVHCEILNYYKYTTTCIYKTILTPYWPTCFCEISKSGQRNQSLISQKLWRRIEKLRAGACSKIGILLEYYW